jgi:WD40 repeat protein/DNA-binding SARP family transcriptional activator
MAHLEMQFLGGFHTSLDGEHLTTYESSKVRALLAYLAVEVQRPQPRESLAALLWPDWPDSAALSNLRYALSDLRKVIGDRTAEPPFLLIRREALQFNTGSDHRLDIAQFSELATGGDRIERLEKAVALYQGQFLEGFSVGDAAPFEDWLRLKREQLQRCYQETLHRLAAGLEVAGEYDRALGYAHVLVDVEPLDESAHRQVMRLLAFSGRGAEALAQYEACRGVLQQELGASPSAETEELYQLLLEGELPPALAEVTAPARLPRRIGACPYRGLAVFREQDAGFFFGREEFTGRLQEALTRRPMVAVVLGSSGSGKSSAVYAGLLPKLRQQGDWIIAALRPGEQPFRSLAGAFIPHLEPDLSETERLIQSSKLEEALYSGELALEGVVERIVEHLDSRLLLLVDQFEELYTLCPEAETRRRFLDGLLGAVGSSDSNFVLLLTMRADFMGRALAYRPFADALQQASVLLGPMNRDELRAAVEMPAEIQGAAFEPGLVERLLDDVGQEPGSLPLLEFALTLLWEHNENGWLTHQAYEDIGRVEGALACYADQVFDALDQEEQQRARRALVQLVRPGEGTEDTRRVATRDELGDENWQLTQHLADRRLVVTGSDPAGHETAEVVHEALIQKWDLFREWMEADRAFRAWQERLRVNLRQWQDSSRDEGALLAGAPLSVAEGWLVERSADLTPVEKDFIQESQRRQDRRQRERERRRRWTVTGLAVGLLVALILTGVAVVFANRSSALAVQNAESARFANTQQAIAESEGAKAEDAREEAEGLASLRSRDAQVNQSLALAARSQIALQANDSDLALALAWEANQIPDPPGQAQMALSQAAYAPGTSRLFLGHGTPVWSVDVSPDGRYGLSGDESGVIYLWDLDTGEALRRLEGHTDIVASLEFTPDGRHAVSASQDETLIYWDLERGEIIHRLSGHGDGVNTVAISPDGRFAASGSGMLWEWDPWSMDDNSVRLWDLQSGEEIRRFTLTRTSIKDVKYTPDGGHLVIGSMWDQLILLDIHTGKVLSRGDFGDIMEVALTPDGRFAVLVDFQHYIHMVDLQTGEQVPEFEKHHNSTIFGLDISPDGERLLSGSSEIIEYHLETGEELNHFNIYANAIAYLPDGRSALIGSQDQTVRLLALGSGAEIGRIPTAFDTIKGVAIDPGGRTLVRAEGDTLSLWSLETGEEIWNARNDEGYWDTKFSPDGTQVLAGGWVAFAGLYDAANGELLTRLESDGSFEGHKDGAVDAVTFHPSGKFVLTGSQGYADHLIYWDLESGKPVWIFDPAEGSVLGVAISPDGRTALSGEWDGLVEWWDLETGQLIRGLEGHTDGTWGVAFVDDRTALSGSDDGTMILWDLDSGAALQRYLGHADGIKRIAVSPDKRLALSASRDGTMILWDIQSGEPLRRYSVSTDELETAAWHPDGGEAISGDREAKSMRWRIDADLEAFKAWIEGNRYIRPLTCEEREAFNIEPLCERADSLQAAGADGMPAPPPVSGAALPSPLPMPTPLAISPTSAPPAAQAAGEAAWGVNHGAVPLGGGQVWKYSGNAGDQLSVHVAAEQPVNWTYGIERQRESGLLDPTLSMYAPDGSLVAETDDLVNGFVTDAYIESITLPQSGVYRIEVRSYQDQTAGSYRLVLADPRQLVYRHSQEFEGMLSGLALHPDGQRVLVAQGWTDVPATEIYSIWVWDLGSGEIVQQLDGHQEPIDALDISPDGRQVLSIDAGGTAILWDLESGAELRRFENAGTEIIFYPDGQTALVSMLDFSLALWNVSSGEVMRRFEGHTHKVNDLVLSPDGETVYSTSKDNTVRVWRFATGELIATYQPFAGDVTNALAISPEGSRLLVGNDLIWVDGMDPIDAAIAVLDAMTGETLMVLEGHTGGVRSIEFSPDGRYALSGAGDRTLRLWDVGTGEQLALLAGHIYHVSQVALSPDGLTAYSTSADGNLRVWDLGEYIGG